MTDATPRRWRNPFRAERLGGYMPFLWYGILLMGFGGLVSLTDRRHRVGAPRRAAVTATIPVPAAAE